MKYLCHGYRYFCVLNKGMFKRHLRVSDVSSIDEVGQCIKNSTPVSEMLNAELVGNESGDTFITTYHWQEKFASVHAVPQLKQYHHFVFNTDYPGKVKCFENSSSTNPTTITIIDECDNNLPNSVQCDGLSDARKLYLFQKIRQFCPDINKDKLCSAVSTEKVVSERVPMELSARAEGEQSGTLPEPTRKRPTCSYCNEVGHRNSVRNGIFLCPKCREESV